VSWKLADGSVGSGEYDTVLFAIGRDVCTSAIGIDKATLSEAEPLRRLQAASHTPH